MKVNKRLYTAGEKAPGPCSAYKDGFCAEMQRACDLCYENNKMLFKELFEENAKKNK